MAVAAGNGHIFQTLDEAELFADTPLIATQQYLLGRKREMLPGPQGFLARSVHETDSHCHPIDQYQIFFGSPGAYYQRTPLPKVLLHYVDAYSVYGPFGAGPKDPLYFFTLRGEPSNLHVSMPKDRAKVPYRGRRNFKIDLEPLLNEGVPSKGDANVDTLIEPKSDGLAAYMIRIGPETEIVPPAGELRSGRYTVILEGDLTHDGRTFGPRSLGWSSGETSEIKLQGGPDGASVVFLHMPFPTTPSVRLAEMRIRSPPGVIKRTLLRQSGARKITRSKATAEPPACLPE